MERIIDFKTTCNDNEKTVEAFLKEHGFTHQVLVNLKKTDNGITRNGVWAYTNEKISAGDKISVHIVENCNSDNFLPIKIPLDIASEPIMPSAAAIPLTVDALMLQSQGNQTQP